MENSLEHQGCPVGGQYHRLTAVSADGSTIVAFQVGVKRKQASASFLAVVCEQGSSPIVIAEVEIAAPATTWELRGEGIWADHICETPFEHWSYGLEAFALRLDDPVELLGRGYGDRVPLGWELEFESDNPSRMADTADSSFDCSQFGTCHGILLFKSRELDFDGSAIRQHWTTSPSPVEVALPLTGSTRWGASRVALPVRGGTWWFATSPQSVNWEYQPD